MLRKIRVLHVLTTSSFSGAENVACQVIKSVDSSDNSTSKEYKFESFYCSPDGPIKNTLITRGVNFIPMKSWSLSSLYEAIKTVNPDIIHTHDMKATFYTSLICWRIPIISHIHNNNYNSRRLTLKTILFFISSLKIKHIFWVSKSAFEGFYLHKFLKKKSSVLLNIVDSDELMEKVEQDNNDYAYDIVFIGRLSFPKDPLRLIEVINQCKTILPYIKVAIIGTGELDSEVKDIINKLKLSSNISLLGFKDNPYKILKCSKVMLMTSRWEGLPMCAIESMILGVPIVSTPTDGLKEIIIDGVTGYLKDKNNDLVNCLIQLITNLDVREKFSNNCLERSKVLFDKKKYSTLIVEQYKNAIKSS